MWLAQAVTVLVVLMMNATAWADSRLVQVLATDPSPKVRAQAALRLATQPPTPEVQTALIAALDDPASIVRGSAARALGEIGGDEAYAPLCRTARDADGFVAKWSRWAAVRVASRARTIAITVQGLQVEPSRLGSPGDRRVRLLAEDMTRNLQDGVLAALVETGRFDVDAGMDFTDEVEGAQRLPGPAQGPGVRVAIRGRLARLSGDERSAEVEVRAEAQGPSGVLLWEGVVRATGAQATQGGQDEYVDEFTIPKDPVDARVRAAEAAGRAVAQELARALGPQPLGPERTRRER